MKELNNVLDNLYNGSISINEKLPMSYEYSETAKESNEILKKLENQLDYEQKDLLNKYIEIKSQIISIECKEKFSEEYKLAAKLIIAVIK